MEPALHAFYEFSSMHMEPWDGPAGIVLTDGRHACCVMDRNGLRPARWVQTRDRHITLASEIGVWDYRPEDVIAKGRLKPGEMIVIDTKTSKLLMSDDIDHQLQNRHPYEAWMRERLIRLSADPVSSPFSALAMNKETLTRLEKLFQVTFEERNQILKILAQDSQEATGSMGDDTPLPVLSLQRRSLFDSFRQQFAQVTNPPIDPLREKIVMSLETCFSSARLSCRSRSTSTCSPGTTRAMRTKSFRSATIRRKSRSSRRSSISRIRPRKHRGAASSSSC